MILEVAVLNVKEGLEDSFEVDFEKAGKFISSMNGYISHSLKKCVDVNNRYLLQVQWNTVEDHKIRFRKSEEYKSWKKLLHHYYYPFPQVNYYQDFL